MPGDKWMPRAETMDGPLHSVIQTQTCHPALTTLKNNIEIYEQSKSRLKNISNPIDANKCQSANEKSEENFKRDRGGQKSSAIVPKTIVPCKNYYKKNFTVNNINVFTKKKIDTMVKDLKKIDTNKQSERKKGIPEKKIIKKIQKKENGILLKDSSVAKEKKTEQISKICRSKERKQKKKIYSERKVSSKKDQSNKTSTESESSTGPASEYKDESKITISYGKVNISDLLVKQQKLGLEDMKIQLRMLSKLCDCNLETIVKRSLKNISSLRSTSRVSGKPTKKERQKGGEETLADTCDKESSARFLQEAKYTKSEAALLLGDLMTFDEIKKTLRPLTEPTNARKGSLREECGEEWNLEDESECESAAIDEQVDENYSVSPEDTLNLQDEIDTKSDKSPENIAPNIEDTSDSTEQLEGYLYKDMMSYYVTKLEGLTSVKENLTEDLKIQYREILENAIKEYGLPNKEKALNYFLQQQLNARKSSIGDVKQISAADYYESIEKQRVKRVEKYRTSKKASFHDLFAVKYPQDRDLFEIIAPYLQVKYIKVEDKVEEKTDKRRRKKQKSEVTTDGPFNVMQKSGVPTRVWRGALKMAKKKIDLLKKTVEFKQKSGIQHERYHKHFMEYFKKKRIQIKNLRRDRRIGVVLKCRTLQLSDAESTSSFSSGDYYPERELMNSLFYDYIDKVEFPVCPLERKKKKYGKREKLRREKQQERSGCDGSFQGAPNTEHQEKAWHERARQKYYKREARAIEEYLYSSGDEITGLKGPQKESKREMLKEAAKELETSPTDIKIASDEDEVNTDIKVVKKVETKTEDIKKKFHAICMKYKLPLVYEIIDKNRLLAPPYDRDFMLTVIKIGNAFSPFDKSSQFHTAIAKKFMKMGIRTCFGMIYTLQKENANILEDSCSVKGSSLPASDNIEQTAKEKKTRRNKVPLKWLLSNATVQRERHTKWLRRYFGIESAVKTEEKMPLYFGTAAEAWAKFDPLKTRKSHHS